MRQLFLIFCSNFLLLMHLRQMFWPFHCWVKGLKHNKLWIKLQLRVIFSVAATVSCLLLSLLAVDAAAAIVLGWDHTWFGTWVSEWSSLWKTQRRLKCQRLKRREDLTLTSWSRKLWLDGRTVVVVAVVLSVLDCSAVWHLPDQAAVGEGDQVGGGPLVAGLPSCAAGTTIKGCCWGQVWACCGTPKATLIWKKMKKNYIVILIGRSNCYNNLNCYSTLTAA